MKYLRNEVGIKRFGKRVRQIRIAKNISQENLAYDAEIEYSQVSRIERGIINTSISQVFAIAKALNIEPWVLFKFDEV
ncbi:MAG: helix-turn-helix transcriptional regulator [Chitinophagaceae bacterium]|nr:helix-turn-helix transcriptional regulator [Chitinophagaceae bacterium]MBP6046753.1 helix-turn-helix transcriptional regulator [Ferruginibacter sp.]NMD29851.1 helix-turn-helix transcriptional regulator [Bacteroidota bacterium]MBK7089703.1 helix-turn-helix transcriptional regulator [Chitinophagaceae bacterium]MBK7347433.1 helix-turn-helix transcriptional regulator [Chitinophagaceae bacterium]